MYDIIIASFKGRDDVIYVYILLMLLFPVFLQDQMQFHWHLCTQ